MVKPEIWHAAKTNAEIQRTRLKLQLEMLEQYLKYLAKVCAKHPIQKPKTDTVVIPPKETQPKGAS